MEKIAVVGVGYVGLVAAACFAKMGHLVTCIDTDENKILSLRKGVVPFFEPDLEAYVAYGIEKKQLSFTTSYSDALREAHFVVVAVDTPQRADGSCDTTNIFKAAQSIGQACAQDLFVIVKSTVPVGTCQAIESIIQTEVAARQKSFSIEVLSNPEFLKEGAAVRDFMEPDRIIVGVSTERGEEMIRRVYAPFDHPGNIFVIMDRPSSELTKYASNTMLALRISYMNWLSGVAEKTGADIESVRIGMGADRRIGPQFLRSGVGFGGSCFPKDIKALSFLAASFGLDNTLIETIDTINEWQKNRFADQILSYASKNHPDSCTVAIMGLSFKPHTDDMRKAPSLTIIRKLLQAGLHLRAYDPIAIENAKLALTSEEVNSIDWCSTPEEAIDSAHIVAILTEWPQIARLNMSKMLSSMKGKGLFDGRNIFNSEKATHLGFDYSCLGKPQQASVTSDECAYAYIRGEHKK